MKQLVYMPQMLGVPYYPGGMPLNYNGDSWQGNVKDDLVRAVKHYYNFHRDEDPKPTSYERQLLIEFLIYYIHAPCWVTGPAGDEYVKPLQTKANRLKSLEDIFEFIEELTDLLMDPF